MGVRDRTVHRSRMRRCLATAVLLLIGSLVTIASATAVGRGELVRLTTSTASPVHDTATSVEPVPCDDCRLIIPSEGPRQETPKVTLTQASTTSEVDTELTLTATVVDGGAGSWLIDVEGKNAQPLSRYTTDSTLLVSYTGKNVGEDMVIAKWVPRPPEVIRSAGAAPRVMENVTVQASVTHEWIRPPPPKLGLTQGSATARVGTPLTLTATTTGGCCPGTLTMRVEGAHNQSLTVTGEGSPFTAVYTGRNVGTDTVIATFTDRFGPTTATVTHTWTPPEIGVSLDAAASDLGATAVVTVRVPDTVGRRVRVAVTGGPNAGRELDVTGAVPEFQARYVGVKPGVDTIQAALVGDGGPPLAFATATRRWNTPAVALVGSSPSSLVGEVYTVTATVTGTVAGDVSFTVEGANAGVTIERAGLHPTFTARYHGTRAGTDQVTASILIGGVTYSATPLAHGWVEPTVTVNQETETSKAGEPVLLTASVTPSQTAGAVTFTVGGVGEPLVLRDDGRDGRDGTFTASYTRNGEGTDTIVATFTGPEGGSFRSASIQHGWTVDPPPTVVVSPAGTTSCTGSTFAATVSVQGGGTPPAGVTVQLTATTPGAPDQTLTGTTDPDGRVALSFTRAVPGIDSLRATAELAGQTVTSAPATHVWEGCELAVTVGPPGTTSLAGSTFTPSVSVLDVAGAPVAAAAVELTVSMVDQPDTTATLTTDANGLASFPYTRLVQGVDRIAASATEGDRRGQAATSHFWAVGPGLQVFFAPAGTTSVVGGTFTATVLVSEAGRPVVGASGTIRAVMPGQSALERTVRTDATGLASFLYTRPVPGTDTLVADVTAGDRNGRASIVHVWTLVQGLEPTLEPAGTASHVGTEFTATVTVVDAGEQASGADVVFRATRPDQLDVTLATRTDAEGHAIFPYTRTEVGTDTIIATVTLADGRSGEASMTHLWRTEESVAVPPKPPSLVVRGGGVPGGQATALGTGCAAGSVVELRLDDQRVTTTRTTPGGDFQAQLRIPPLPVGRHELTALCTPVRIKASMDVVVPSSSNGTAGAAATTAVAMFGFFVLLGGQLVRFSGGYPTGGS